MILMQAPGPNMAFGSMPSGAAYVSNQYGLIRISNNSGDDQRALMLAGCSTLSPFGGWGTFSFETLADLYAADSASDLVLPRQVGFPRYTTCQIANDPTVDNIGTWYKTGDGHGAGNWDMLPSSIFSELADQARTSAISAAADARSAQDSASVAESVSGPTYATIAAGLAATTSGSSFAVSNSDGTVSIYLNNSGASAFQRKLATTTALQSSTGASLLGKAGGGTLQDTADLAALLSGEVTDILSTLSTIATGGFAGMLMAQMTNGLLRAVTEKLEEGYHSLFDHGAIARVDPEVESSSAIAKANYQAWLDCNAQCKLDGKPLLIPAKIFDMETPSGGTIHVDPTINERGALRAYAIIGLSPELSVINLTNPPTGGLGMQMSSTSDWFGLLLANFSITASFEGVTFTIGNNDLTTDPLNILRILNVTITNSCNSPNAVATRMNYVAGGFAVGMINNAYALAVDNVLEAVNGTGLECRQLEFFAFLGGSAGNGERCVDIKDGVNISIFFAGLTFENGKYLFSHRSAISGSHMVVACQLTNVMDGGYTIQSTGCNTSQWIEFYACNFSAPGLLVDPANHEGVRIHSRRGITTPSVPASGTIVTNTTGHDVDVYIAGKLSSINLSGSALSVTGAGPAFTHARLQAGGTITPGYPETISWMWLNGG